MGLFGGKLNLGKVFDTVSSGVDKLAFTKEEKSELNMKLSDKVADFVHSTLSENTERSKARRVIAYVVVGNFFALMWAVILLHIFEMQEAAEFITGVVSDWKIATAFIMVLGFFFGSYLLRGTKLKKDK